MRFTLDSYLAEVSKMVKLERTHMAEKAKELRVRDNYAFLIQSTPQKLRDIIGRKLRSFTLHIYDEEEQDHTRSQDFLYNPGTVMMQVQDRGNLEARKVWIEDPKELRGKVHKKLQNYRMEVTLFPYQGMRKWATANPPYYPGKVMPHASTEKAMGLALRDILRFIKSNHLPVCLPLEFYYNPLGVDPHRVIFYPENGAPR